MAGKLRVIAGPDTGGVFELPASGTVVLGRDKGTLTQFRERTVSRSHCRLEVVGDRVLVINDSQSGTLVNDRPITRSELRPNDVIRLGEESETRIRFEVEDVHSEATIRGGSVGKILQEEFNALVGKTLGHFQIARLLGSDALGTTFRAWDNRHKRQVALKVFVPEPNLPQRFRMFQPVLGLQHPGLVALWEAGDTDARYWCSLEDVEGETLETLLGSSSRKAGGTGPIPWDQVLRFAIQLTEGLAALHRKNLVHRGITPGAVLLTTSGKEARLSGLWNVRTITDCKTDTADTQDVLRDVAYMPPERAGFGKPATMRGDLYSLGAVLYHMLTGQPPFAGGGDKEIIANIVRNAPAALRTFQPSLPDPLEQAVMSLLAKRPDDRYQNVLDLLTTLRGSALGRPAAGVAGGGVAGDGWRVAGKEKAAGLSVPLPATRHPPPASPPVPPAQAPAAAAKPSDRISFACPCGMTMQTRRQFAGERVRCPWCKTFLIVPGGPARVAPPSQKPVAEELPPEPEAGEEAQHPSVAVPQAPSDLRRSALRGALWIGISVIASNVLKLVTKMIMTRLVLPESYGVLDMAMVFVQGVHMFADVGIGTSIIQSKRGDERDFLDTAWTLQILRGLVLWAIIAAIAWPVSVFFGQPELLLV
ncbi:MAG TPA: oligosaccharide flippase family protein, partial [Gemmataceae bacterium]|nr:oligosaccharide flippase family protein [Gemmataceae bacterium]